MKTLLFSAFAVCVAAGVPTALSAQEHDTSHPAGGAPHPSPTSSPEHMGGAPGMGHTIMTARPHMTTTYHHTTYHHTTYSHTTYHVTGHVAHPTTNAHIDISTYHRNITSERHFHYGDYHAPAGYEYRRWNYGERLPAIYFAQQYWIANYWNFGLAWAPDGCEWIRFGPDAILVDVDTGEIVQVVYGVFY
jgi:Ni/Co efflux regulator RcnB